MRNNKTIPPKNKLNIYGFTMPELLAAAVILSVVLTGFLKAFVDCSMLTNTAGNLTLATAEAHSKMTEIKDYAFNNIKADYHNATFNLTYPGGGTGSITVEEIGDDVVADLLKVTVTVNWQNNDKRNVSTSLISYIAKR